MAKHVIIKPYFSLGGTDLSAQVMSVTFETSADMHDSTTGGDDGSHAMIAGLKNWTLTLTLAQDYAGSSVNATMHASHGVDAEIELRPSTDAVSQTNPKFTFTAILESYSPLNMGAPGDFHTTDPSFQPGSSNSTIVMETS